MGTSPHRSRDAAGSLDWNDSESAVVQVRSCQRNGTVDADVDPARNRPSPPRQGRVRRFRGGGDLIPPHASPVRSCVVLRCLGNTGPAPMGWAPSPAAPVDAYLPSPLVAAPVDAYSPYP